jgi:hypothetical protein
VGTVWLLNCLTDFYFRFLLASYKKWSLSLSLALSLSLSLCVCMCVFVWILKDSLLSNFILMIAFSIMCSSTQFKNNHIIPVSLHISLPHWPSIFQHRIISVTSAFPSVVYYSMSFLKALITELLCLKLDFWTLWPISLALTCQL